MQIVNSHPEYMSQVEYIVKQGSNIFNDFKVINFNKETVLKIDFWKSLRTAGFLFASVGVLSQLNKIFFNLKEIRHVQIFFQIRKIPIENPDWIKKASLTFIGVSFFSIAYATRTESVTKKIFTDQRKKIDDLFNPCIVAFVRQYNSKADFIFKASQVEPKEKIPYTEAKKWIEKVAAIYDRVSVDSRYKKLLDQTTLLDLEKYNSLLEHAKFLSVFDLTSYETNKCIDQYAVEKMKILVDVSRAFLFGYYRGKSTEKNQDAYVGYACYGEEAFISPSSKLEEEIAHIPSSLIFSIDDKSV